MSHSEETSSKKKKRKSPAPLICRIAGVLILLVVIASCIPVTVPRFMGYELYHIVSGSMEPTIPVGSVVYVKKTDPSEIKAGDIMAFVSGESVVVHRVVENWSFEGKFTTKGDANAGEDLNEVLYDQAIGVVTYHVRTLGQFLMVLTSNAGKVLVMCFAACGALLCIVAGRLET